MPHRDYTVESVDNAMVLLLMLRRDGAVQLSSAARELGVAKSTVHRLLGTLLRRGFVIQDMRRRYLAGPALGGFGSAATASEHIRITADRHLHALSRMLDETTHLMVREGGTVRFLDSVEGENPVHIGSRAGAVLPAHLTSGGKAMLAALAPEELASVLSREPAVPHPDRLRPMLAAVRAVGYGTNMGESERGVAAVGVAIRDGGSWPTAAITVSMPSFRASAPRVREAASAVQEIAARLERELAEQLGYSTAA